MSLRRPLATLALLGALVPGCARRPPAPIVVPTTVAVEPYRLQPGDVLEIRFQYHPTETQRVTVRPDGGVALDVTGDLHAGGLTIEQLEALVREQSARYLRDPVVNVVMMESLARAYIGGEVTNAGFVTLTKPITVLQAILERGGFTTGADIENIVVISRASGDEGEGTARRVSIKDMIGGGPAEGGMLAPEDVVYVPKTGIARANAWVEQWIDGLTPQLLKGVRFPTVGGSSSGN
jgi:protein involved in polysaccharide export with SLBB domain